MPFEAAIIKDGGGFTLEGWCWCFSWCHNTGQLLNTSQVVQWSWLTTAWHLSQYWKMCEYDRQSVLLTWSWDASFTNQQERANRCWVLLSIVKLLSHFNYKHRPNTPQQPGGLVCLFSVFHSSCVSNRKQRRCASMSLIRWMRRIEWPSMRWDGWVVWLIRLTLWTSTICN